MLLLKLPTLFFSPNLSHRSLSFNSPFEQLHLVVAACDCLMMSVRKVWTSKPLRDCGACDLGILRRLVLNPKQRARFVQLSITSPPYLTMIARLIAD
jgi:hypothetical protein